MINLIKQIKTRIKNKRSSCTGVTLNSRLMYNATLFSTTVYESNRDGCLWENDIIEYTDTETVRFIDQCCEGAQS